MKMFLYLFVFLFIFFVNSTFSDELSPDDLIKKYKDLQYEILSELSDVKTWRNATYLENEEKTKKLMKLIELTYIVKIRNDKFKEILFSHIYYAPYAGILDGALKPHHAYLPVLFSIHINGMDIIDALNTLFLKEVKSRDPYDGYDYLYDETVAHLIFYVYGTDGSGLKIARKRLELEKVICNDIEKKRIEKLENNILFELFSDDDLSDINRLKYVYGIQSLEPYTEDAERIKTFLSNPESWKDATYLKDENKTEKLLKYLELAHIIRCLDIEKILIEHITYSPIKEQSVENIKEEEQYPVYNLLREIGPLSIIPLIELIKSYDFKKSNDKAFELAVKCLFYIYERSGFGKEMTKYRLQLEIENSKGKEKQLLQKALESSFLKN